MALFLLNSFYILFNLQIQGNKKEKRGRESERYAQMTNEKKQEKLKRRLEAKHGCHGRHIINYSF